MDCFGGNKKGITVRIGHKNKNFYKEILVPFFAILTVVGLGFCIRNVTYADSSATTQTKVTVKVKSVISLSAPDKIIVDLGVPTADGKFVSGKDKIKVSTNDIAGYSVYLTSSSASTDLKHENTGINAKIRTISSSESITGGKTKFDTQNSWGWSADGTVFNPIVPTGTKHSSTVKTLFKKGTEATISGGTSNYEESDLTIGATGDLSLPAGSYKGSILLTAISNSDKAVLCLHDSTISCS